MLNNWIKELTVEDFLIYVKLAIDSDIKSIFHRREEFTHFWITSVFGDDFRLLYKMVS